jgi:integrase/recombinase XerD
MVFRRRGARTYTFQARLPNGRYQQLQTGAPFTAAGKALASRTEAMWNSLALEHRAWDLLEPVLAARRGDRAQRLGRLYDFWVTTRYSPGAMRRLLADVDVEPLVATFETWYRQHVRADTVAHAVAHVRHLIPACGPCPASGLTPAALSRALAEYPGTRNTKRRVHSHWSRFFGYCVSVHSAFDENPMARVERPGEERRPIRFYELDTVERIVAAQPTPGRRALFALLYSTGIEVGTALRLTRADVWDASQEIRAAGTKTHTRDRVSSISDWGWPLVRDYVRSLLPGAPLFPGYRVDVVWHWHRETTNALGLAEHLRVHAARHHWAVLALRAGVPVRVVQLQLGHATPTLTIGLYGAFLPSGDDRAVWRARITSYEMHRREVR